MPTLQHSNASVLNHTTPSLLWIRNVGFIIIGCAVAVGVGYLLYCLTALSIRRWYRFLDDEYDVEEATRKTCPKVALPAPPLPSFSGRGYLHRPQTFAVPSTLQTATKPADKKPLISVESSSRSNRSSGPSACIATERFSFLSANIGRYNERGVLKDLSCYIPSPYSPAPRLDTTERSLVDTDMPRIVSLTPSPRTPRDLTALCFIEGPFVPVPVSVVEVNVKCAVGEENLVVDDAVKDASALESEIDFTASTSNAPEPTSSSPPALDESVIATPRPHSNILAPAPVRASLIPSWVTTSPPKRRSSIKPLRLVEESKRRSITKRDSDHNKENSNPRPRSQRVSKHGILAYRAENQDKSGKVSIHSQRNRESLFLGPRGVFANTPLQPSPNPQRLSLAVMDGGRGPKIFGAHRYSQPVVVS